MKIKYLKTESLKKYKKNKITWYELMIEDMFLIPMNVWIYLESLRVCMVVVTELFFHSFIVTKIEKQKSLNQ